MYPKLASLVVDLILKRVTKENVLEIFEQTRIYEFAKLDFLIKIMIQSKTHHLIYAKSFVNIQKSTLEFLLSQPKLSISEPELFDACIRWVRAECGRNGVDPQPAQLRKNLGDLVYLIRIFSFVTKAFMKGPGLSGIFTSNEIVEVIYHLESLKESNNAFIAKFNPKARIMWRAKWIKISTEIDFQGSSHSYSHSEITSKNSFFFKIICLQGFSIKRPRCSDCEFKELIVEQNSKVLVSYRNVNSFERHTKIIFNHPIYIRGYFFIQFTLSCRCYSSERKSSGIIDVLTASNDIILCKFLFDEMPSCVSSVSLLL